jgi:AraC-like DNA-binding protein
VTPGPVPERYVEYAPPVALREHVECFWTRGAVPVAETRHHVIPDGCIDLLFTYDSLAASDGPASAFAVGTMTRPLSVGATEAAAYVGVRFWPGRALPFLGVPAAEITDLRVAIADLWRPCDGSLVSTHRTALGGWRAPFERLLLARLERAEGADRTVDAAVRAILRAGGNLSIAALAPALGVTRQHLARAFARHVGVPPKVFARVARVRKVLAKARVASHLDWSALALDAGYYDQAHLAGEVREITGRTPTDWLVSV